MSVEGNPEALKIMFDKLCDPLHMECVQHWEAEEGFVSFLEREFGELFTREVQLELGDEC